MNVIFEKPVLCLITKGSAQPATYLQDKADIIGMLKRAVAAGVSIIQIREKRLTSKQVFEIVTEAAAITAGSRTRLLVNDRTDIALAARADGVHLRSDSVETRVVRKSVPKGFMIGVSAHDMLALERARDEGADFATFGPIFDTPGKSAPISPEELQRACRLLAPFPILALGGIDGSNAAFVLSAGAAGFAAIRFLNSDEGLGYAKRMSNA